MQPDYKVQSTYWDAEATDMVTEDSDRMFYQMEKKEHAEDLSFENNGGKNESKS